MQNDKFPKIIREEIIMFYSTKTSKLPRSTNQELSFSKIFLSRPNGPSTLEN